MFVADTRLDVPSHSSVSCCSPSPTCFLTSEQRAAIKKEMTTHYTSLTARGGNENIKYYPGKHCTVFEHKLFPGLIFKLMGLEQAKMREKETKIAREIVRQHCLNFCFVPQAECIDLEMKIEVIIEASYYVSPPVIKTIQHPVAVLVEEKMDGYTTCQAKEMSELDFEQAESIPEFKFKVAQIYIQTALFICKVGYWDFDWRNAILLKDLQGLAFIDFERTKPSPSNITIGLCSLIRIAPSFCFEDIFRLAHQHEIDLIKELHSRQYHPELATIEAYTRKRAELLTKRKEFRAWHLDRGISSVAQLLQVKTDSIIEKKIVQVLNDSLRQSKKHTGRLISDRTWRGQLFFDEQKRNPIDYPQALENLKAQGIIFSWKVRTINSLQAGYTIKF